MKYSIKVKTPEGLRGLNLLDTPLGNKGTAFNDEERVAFALQGLLPPQVESIEEQSVRAYEAYKAKTTDLERHIYLRQLQDTNETGDGVLDSDRRDLSDEQNTYARDRNEFAN
jgi:hypothetical protein